MFTATLYAITLFVLVTLVFLVAQWKKDNSVMDVCYGPLFLVATWTTIILKNSYELSVLILASMVSAWAIRLSYRIGRKNWGTEEDQRYANWREKWHEKGRWYFILRSYLQINLLQGIIIFLVSIPVILTVKENYESLPLLAIVGLAIFSTGILLETIADAQLDAFVKQKKQGDVSNSVMTRGLFRYSRRPNYFGESLVWWGVALFAAAVSPYPYLAFVSPIVITYILINVTGPLTEKMFLEKYGDEYTAYMKKTSYFIPWFPKQN